MQNWTIDDSAELYNVRGWGMGYFGINDQGRATVRPHAEAAHHLDLKTLVDDLKKQDISTPVLARFADILDDRIAMLCACFAHAAKEYRYFGKYYGVYPIKVNQQRHVVEEIVRCGRDRAIGLEAGSKPELQAVLPIMDNPEALIICNGYKDEEYIELALLAQKMGKNVFLVVEKLSEFYQIHTIAQRLGLRPNIGIRVKLTNSGSGKWEDSGGDQSKFGLGAGELLDAVDFAARNDMLDCIRMVHFHLGSQITNIRKIKKGLKEVAHFFVQLRLLGCNVSFVDIGGGLGVDYDGSGSIAASSVNYTPQEYANDAVYELWEACEKNELDHPNIVTESGRAITAHHSVLIVNVLESTGLPTWDEATNRVEDGDHDIVKDMYALYAELSSSNMMESWHDAQQLKEEALNRFGLGLLDLPSRAKTERLYWSLARKALKLAQNLRHQPEEFAYLPNALAEKYFCNFSLFQSLPDAWAIGHVFPIMPIHRLNEKPNCIATLHDVTCDSDGKIDRYVGAHDNTKFLPVHAFTPGEPYYLAVFLVGAYQEILGDMHNLFGDTNAVHVVFDSETGQYKIAQTIDGETAADVLEYVQFNPRDLVRTMEKWVAASIAEGRITGPQGKEFLATYRSGLYSYTYLED